VAAAAVVVLAPPAGEREYRSVAVVYWRIAVTAKVPGVVTVRRGSALVRYCRRRVTCLQQQGALAAARDFEAGIYLQDLLVAAVAAILLTRLFLGLTGFPRVGGGGLHVAHMLWGGLLMLVALVLLLAVIGKPAKRLAALIGGGGFGLFIDELGKFITADNDYFFQPTIALIYSLFVLLFLGFRAIERRSLSSTELLANAAEMVREVVIGGATESEIRRALRLLERSEVEGQLADGLRQAIAGAVRATEGGRPRLARAAARAWRSYDGLIAWRWFQRAVLILFVAQALIGIPVFLVLLLGLAALSVPSLGALVEMPDIATFVAQATDSSEGLVGSAASTASALLALAFAMVGVARLRRSRLGAYRWLERSVLVSVLLGQVLLFWQDQLAAVVQLGWNLLLLAALRYAIRQEEARQALEIGAVAVLRAGPETGTPP
jgi:hypothetical protein